MGEGVTVAPASPPDGDMLVFDEAVYAWEKRKFWLARCELGAHKFLIVVAAPDLRAASEQTNELVEAERERNGISRGRPSLVALGELPIGRAFSP